MKPRHKYRVSPVSERTAEGVVFASKAEMTRYLELRVLEKMGKIELLSLQPRFKIIGEGARNKARYYTADFFYIENRYQVVEEVKGVFTTDYTLRRDLFLQNYKRVFFREVHKGIVKDFPPEQGAGDDANTV